MKKGKVFVILKPHLFFQCGWNNNFGNTSHKAQRVVEGFGRANRVNSEKGTPYYVIPMKSHGLTQMGEQILRLGSLYGYQAKEVRRIGEIRHASGMTGLNKLY